MKTKLLLLLLFVSLMFSCGDIGESINQLFNKSDRSIETEALPEESLDAEETNEEATQDDYQISYKEDKFMGHDRYSVPNNQIDYEFYWNGSNYYPIGWSRDGNIAFREFREFDGAGGCQDNLIVQSMVTDKIIKDIQLDFFMDGSVGDWDDHCDFEKIWRKERRTILKYLNRYEIQDNSFGFMNKSKEITSNNREYKIKLSQDLLETYDGYNYEGENRTSYKLKVYVNGRSKTISKATIRAHNIDYIGYYKSPFEERIAIVLQYQDDQSGEYANNGGIIIIGCDLHPRSWN